MSDKYKEDLEMIDLDQTGALPPEEKLPKEVTMDTQLLTDVSAEISLSMEDTQPLVNIKALAEEAAKQAASEEMLSGETRVITPPDVKKLKKEVPGDTMVILDLDKTSELSGLLEDIKPGDDGSIIPERSRRAATNRVRGYADTEAGDYTDTEAGDYTDTEAGDYTDTEAGDYTDTEAGDYTDTEAGDYTDTAAGDYTDTEAGDYTDAAPGDYEGGSEAGDYTDDPDAVYEDEDYSDESEAEGYDPAADEIDAEIDKVTGLYLVPDEEDEDEAGEEADELPEDAYADPEEDGEYAEGEDGTYIESEDGEYAEGENGDYIESEDGEDPYIDPEEDGADAETVDGEYSGSEDETCPEAVDGDYSGAEADAYPDTEDGEYADTEEDAADTEGEEDPRLFETGEIMSLEEGHGRDDKAVAPSIRKNPVNMIVLVAAAVCFLLLCVFIGVQSYKNRSVAENKPYMYDVGERLAGIGISGQSGLMAMANAGHGSSVPDEDPDPDGETGDEDAVISVKLNFTSVAKDIKLKFINAETDRLIMDVPFEVVLTPANGEQLRLVDEDMDGIIYKKDVAGGDYKLAVLDQEGCDFVSIPTTVKVKENISYQKIDVKEEIKKETEVNAAVEDTGNGKEPEEGPPPTPTPTTGDTVEWVESTKTPKEGSDGYKVVDAGDIPEPDYSEASVSRAGNTAAGNLAAACEPCSGADIKTNADTKNSADIKTNADIKVGAGRTISAAEDPTSTPTPIPVKPDETPTPTPTPEDEPTPGPDETPTPKPTGDDPSGSPTPTDKDDKKDPKKDKTTKLKDKNGNQLYIKNGDKYQEAVYADYYKEKTFYIQGTVEYIYTGWQTLDGKTYFFDKNGNKVTGDQIIKGVKYHFDENGVLIQENAGGNSGGNNGGKGILGIDVSKWNGSIDWNAVKASGVNFVIIRCGYRGSSTGVLVEDPTFRTNIQGAQAAGIKVGLYFFTQAVNEVEAVEEASMCLSLAQGYNISYPIFIDVEFTVNKNGRADGLDRATRSAVARAFCETINNGGYAGGVYSSKSWYGYSLDMSVIGGYKIWLAHYTSQTDYSGHYDIWQYSSKGSISGIKGNVDMNYSYMGY